MLYFSRGKIVHLSSQTVEPYPMPGWKVAQDTCLKYGMSVKYAEIYNRLEKILLLDDETFLECCKLAETKGYQIFYSDKEK